MRRLILLLAVALLALPAAARADADPTGCSDDLTYDSSIPTFSSVIGNELGGNDPDAVDRHVTADLYKYGEALVTATATNPRVRVIEKTYGVTSLGVTMHFFVVGTPDDIANLDAGRDDGAFWSGVTHGTTAQADALAQVDQRPAFAWVTGAPHGNEPAGGEASMRLLYELAARTDCQNLGRLRALDLFINPVRNPDGRDSPPVGVRTTAWDFDPNRDVGVRTQPENADFVPQLVKYPGLFFIDAHQQTSGYFFPPNEDPVNHEISHFALDFIQNKIGPTLQQKFDDQSSAYRNYNTYDLFTPEYGDTVPSLIMGAAGMTYEKGETESYGKQVYDHYLAMDTTVNLTADDKDSLLTAWIKQWQEAVDQGAACELQPNELVSPLHTTIDQQPKASICGYYFPPGLHSGDVAKLISDLQVVGVQVFQLTQDTPMSGGMHELGTLNASHAGTLPAGTLYIPLAQPQKHWIESVLEEDPVIPFPYFYDVVTWSYTLMRGLAGDGALTTQLPSGTPMEMIGTPELGGTPPTPSSYYAWATDSMAGLGLTVDVLEKGATVTRSATAFDAGGRHFPTGTALVSAASLAGAGVNLATLAAARQTPVAGLPSRPVASFPIRKPKIGLYAGATEPTNPDPAGAGTKGHCGAGAGVALGEYCEALFTLKEKDHLPVAAVTDADMPNLLTDGFTALVDPGGQNLVAAGALQAFVNGGGIYVGVGSNGATTALAGGMTNVNTNSVSVVTPGSTFSTAVKTTDPAAWGFDAGAFVYRESDDDPAFDPTTLAGNGVTIPDAVAAISYAKPLHSYGYDGDDSAATTVLAGRPVVVDQPFGSGHVVLLGFDPFYRAWHEGSERMAINGILMPVAASVAPGSKGVPAATAAAPAAGPVKAAALPALGQKPAAAATTRSRDVRIVVAASDGPALRQAVRAAHLRKRLRRHVRYVRGGGTTSLVVRGARTSDSERQAPWVGRIMRGLLIRRVRPLSAQL